MAGITFSKCAEKGLYAGAAAVAWDCFLHRDQKVSHIFINGAAIFAGVVAGNHTVKNNEFFNDWEAKTKVVAILAITFFTSMVIWGVTSHFDATVDLQSKAVSEVSGLFITYIIGAASYIA